MHLQHIVHFPDLWTSPPNSLMIFFYPFLPSGSEFRNEGEITIDFSLSGSLKLNVLIIQGRGGAGEPGGDQLTGSDFTN